MVKFQFIPVKHDLDGIGKKVIGVLKYRKIADGQHHATLITTLGHLKSLGFTTKTNFFRYLKRFKGKHFKPCVDMVSACVYEFS